MIPQYLPLFLILFTSGKRFKVSTKSKTMTNKNHHRSRDYQDSTDRQDTRCMPGYPCAEQQCMPGYPCNNEGSRGLIITGGHEDEHTWHSAEILDVNSRRKCRLKPEMNKYHVKYSHTQVLFAY